MMFFSRIYQLHDDDSSYPEKVVSARISMQINAEFEVADWKSKSGGTN